MPQPIAIRFKICCITSVEEAALAIRYGATALGLVSAMPSGPGVIAEELIAEIVATVPPGVATFLLSSGTEAEHIIDQVRTCRANTVQLVDRVHASVYSELRRALPGTKLVQVVHVTDLDSVTEAVHVAEQVDAILLDSGNQSLPIPELGGTGRTHDWSISRQIRDRVSKPLFLAGGLSAENVRAAVDAVRPFGVDVCSGVRVAGRLDEDRLAHFVRALRQLQTLS